MRAAFLINLAKELYIMKLSVQLIQWNSWFQGSK